jgi:PAS domain S-box-containing protein
MALETSSQPVYTDSNLGARPVVIRLNREGLIISHNETAAKLIELNSGAQHFNSFIHDRPWADDFFSRLTADGQATGEWRPNTNNVHLCYFFEGWTDGEYGYIVTVTDCSAEKNLEQRLKETERRYKSILSNLNGMAYRAKNNEVLTMEYVSDAAERITGVKAEDFTSGKTNPADIVHPDDLAKTRENLAKGFAANQPVHHTFRIITPDGQERWILEKCRAVFDRNAHITAIEGLLFDVSRDKERETRSLRNDETLRIFAEHLPFAVAMFDTEMRYVLHSPQWLRNFRKTEPLIDQCHYDVFPGIPERWREAHRAGLSGESRSSEADQVIWPDKREQWFRWQLHPWYTQEGAIGGIIIFSEDITALRTNQEEKNRIQNALDAASDGIFIIDTTTLKFLYANGGATRKTGYSTEDLLEMTPIDLNPAYDFEAFRTTIQNIGNQPNQIIVFETELFRKEGSAMQVEISLQLTDDVFNETACIAVCRDRSQQKIAEDLLAQSEARYRTIVSSMSDLIFVFSLDGRVVDVHSRSDELLMMPVPELIGKRIDEVVPIPLAQRYLRHADQLLKEKRIQRFEYDLTIKGRTFWYLAALNLHPDGDKVTANVVDITTRKEIEIELQHRESILSAVSAITNTLLTTSDWKQSMDHALSVLGKAANASRAYLFSVHRSNTNELLFSQTNEWCNEGTEPEIDNPLFQNMPVLDFGYDRWVQSFIEGKPIFGAVEDFPANEQPILEAQGIKSLATFPLHLGKDWVGFVGFDQCVSNRVWSSSELEALRAAASAISTAITRQHTENQLRILNEELEQRVAERTERLENANRELEAFSYSVSHDLRAPLRAVVGFSNILLDDHADQLNDDGKRMLKVIESNTLRMGGLIDDLIAFARIGKQALSLHPIDMVHLIEEVLTDFKIDEAPHITVNVGELPQSVADQRLIKQVWHNLIANALKYSALSESPHIEVSGSIQGNEVVYAVRDNGVGFEMEYYDKLFGVFQRLHSNPEFEGTGIGLALVKRILEKHDGRIWAVGVPDQGATFYFALPVR